MDIQTVAEHLSREGIVNEDRAKDFVNGAMRSFGKRLNQLLTNIPNRIGLDRSREGVADPVPLLALFSIAKDKHGATRNRLTDNGAMAASLVLVADSSGISSFNGIGDPTEVIGFGMERLSAALIDRVAQSLGVGRDEAIKTMTAKMGAG